MICLPLQSQRVVCGTPQAGRAATFSRVTTSSGFSRVAGNGAAEEAYALDKQNGALIWRLTRAGAEALPPVPVGAGARVVDLAASSSGTIWAVSDKGQLLKAQGSGPWTVEPAPSNLTRIGGGATVAVVSHAGKIALRAAP